jgi:predicted nucleic acid-binding protein
MVKALVDTNILFDDLDAVPQARAELRRYEGSAISIVTWMEVMVRARPDVEAATRAQTQPARSTARRHNLGDGTGARHAVGDVQHQGLSRQRSGRSRTVFPIAWIASPRCLNA